ncbi:hypothetical protein O999_12605 [Pseudomonas putida LF54]|uniref:hypothetical protein n=1 Tax=Pseudomonas putida TaxID=303 RepID=UPI0003AF28F3|nr:hypothetical protein [Pseudomonas putida]ERK99284.1 hypothetical protein O999_12605 [Pseudomonas putida LF54]
MSEQAKRYEQAVVDAVIAGDVGKLESALRWLSKTDAGRFLAITKQLLDTERKKKLCTMVIAPLNNTLPLFYYDGNFVYAAAYVDCEGFAMKEAHPSGAGVHYGDVAGVVTRVRAEFDEAVVKRVRELKIHIKDLVDQMCGHSTADICVIGQARAELLTGQALLVAAVSILE